MIELAAGVRLRPIPELATCLAFTPSPPRLHTLNPAAWLIAELCSRHRGAALKAEFIRRTEGAWADGETERHFADGVAHLLEAGVLQESPA